MKKKRQNVKKTIKKRIEIREGTFLQDKKMANITGTRAQMRIEGKKPKPVNVDLVSRTEIRANRPANEHMLERKFRKEYEPEQVVDYDAVVIIGSYNRFKKLNRILKQLYTEESKYKIKMVVYNDGSTDINYGKLPKMYPEIDYLRGKENQGKHFYWKTITTLFQKASEYVCNAVIQIDDDFILCENFIDNLMDSFFEGKKENNKNVAIYYHIPLGSTNGWGMANWVDGGAIYDTKFLKEINYSISMIPKTRWTHDPELSSGVWKQVSTIIQRNGLFTYKLEHSLAEHDGNEDSKMNTEQRNRSSIYTENFKDKKDE